LQPCCFSFFKKTICFVNDGSKDETGKVIDNIASQSSQIKTLHLKRNSGKAEAIRQAMLKQLSDDDCEWFGYWDADLATPLEEIDHLLNYSDDSRKLLICSRVKRLGASISRHPWRHILGRLMATLISFVLKLPVYDTQCGAKLIDREDIEDVFSEHFVSKWLFDVEIIARLKNKYKEDNIQQRIIEVPVFKWKDIPGSKLKFQHMLSALIEIVKIHWKYNIQRKAPDTTSCKKSL
jgi:glycosyltransferase involved in cell wall biosynthesis